MFAARLRADVAGGSRLGHSVMAARCPGGCLGLEGIVSKRLGSRYRSGHSRDWLKFKNPEAPVVKREAEEEWGW